MTVLFPCNQLFVVLPYFCTPFQKLRVAGILRVLLRFVQEAEHFCVALRHDALRIGLREDIVYTLLDEAQITVRLRIQVDVFRNVSLGRPSDFILITRCPVLKTISTICTMLSVARMLVCQPFYPCPPPRRSCRVVSCSSWPYRNRYKCGSSGQCLLLPQYDAPGFEKE